MPILHKTTQTPRYAPRGGAPFRSVTLTRRRLGSQRAESTCPAQTGGDLILRCASQLPSL
eukprot:1415882-Prymnesium_polylepis.1